MPPRFQGQLFSFFFLVFSVHGFQEVYVNTYHSRFRVLKYFLRHAYLIDIEMEKVKLFLASTADKGQNFMLFTFCLHMLFIRVHAFNVCLPVFELFL